MKTPQQWAEHLPEPIRTEFLENIDPKYSQYAKQCSHLKFALILSFDWKVSKQGGEYWENIMDRAVLGDFDNIQTKPITREIQLLRDVETEVNISGIISNHTYSEIVKLLKEIDGN